MAAVTNDRPRMNMATTTNRTDKILVVDDDARIRDLLRRYLTQEGFEIMIAEDGKALNRILDRPPVLAVEAASHQVGEIEKQILVAGHLETARSAGQAAPRTARGP